MNATDDKAIDVNVEDMLTVFTNLSPDTLTLSPADYALDEIDYIKFCSRKYQVLVICSPLV